MFARVEQFVSCSFWVSSLEGLNRVLLLRYKAHLTGREKWCGVDPRLASNGLSTELSLFGALPFLNSSGNAHFVKHKVWLLATARLVLLSCSARSFRSYNGPRGRLHRITHPSRQVLALEVDQSNLLRTE